MSAFILCISLEESDVTVTPSVTSVNWICWWCSPMAHFFSVQQHWLLFPTWVRNVNPHPLVQSKLKICERQLVLKGN